MKTYNNMPAFLQLITATRLAFQKNSLRVAAWTYAIGLFAPVASQIRAETTTQTIQVTPGTQTVTIIVTSTTPVTTTATTAQTGQNNTSVNAQSIPPLDNDLKTSLALPKARGVNMYFMFGPTWMNTRNEYGSVDLYGVTLAFGWRIDTYSKFQIDSSLLAGSHDEYSPYYHGHVDYIVGLDAVTHSFIIPFDAKGVFGMRVSPSIGLAYIATNYRGSYYSGYSSYYTNSSDGKFTWAWGGGIGFTVHTSKRFMLDLGARYMRMGGVQYYWGEIPSTDTLA